MDLVILNVIEKTARYLRTLRSTLAMGILFVLFIFTPISGMASDDPGGPHSDPLANATWHERFIINDGNLYSTTNNTMMLAEVDSHEWLLIGQHSAFIYFGITRFDSFGEIFQTHAPMYVERRFDGPSALFRNPSGRMMIAGVSQVYPRGFGHPFITELGLEGQTSPDAADSLIFPYICSISRWHNSPPVLYDGRYFMLASVMDTMVSTHDSNPALFRFDQECSTMLSATTSAEVLQNMDQDSRSGRYAMHDGNLYIACQAWYPNEGGFETSGLTFTVLDTNLNEIVPAFTATDVFSTDSLYYDNIVQKNNLIVDPNGNAYIDFLGSVDFDNFSAIRVHRPDGSSETRRLSTNGYYTSIVLDSTGTVHLFYTHNRRIYHEKLADGEVYPVTQDTLPVPYSIRNGLQSLSAAVARDGALIQLLAVMVLRDYENTQLLYGFSFYDDEIIGINETNIEGHQQNIPFKQNISIYPNPSNATSVLMFETRHAGTVKVSVFNLLGQLVQDYSFAVLSPGIHQTPLFRSRVNPVPSGTYFIRIETGDEVVLKKMQILR